MSVTLTWMRADAPYMPIATFGLLCVVSAQDPGVTAEWRPDGAGRVLHIETALDAEGIAAAVLDAPLPDTSSGSWPASGQALASALRRLPDPLGTYQRWVHDLEGPEHALMLALATDQLLTDEGLPARSRLARGTKGDLAPFRPLRGATVAALADELVVGPDFRPGKSGAAMGLAPEVHTFGGTTGREPKSTGVESALLSRLIRHGIIHLPPSAGRQRGSRAVGGPLVSEEWALSWPRWTFPCGPKELRVLFGLAGVHAPEPDLAELIPRGIDAVYRSRPRKISTTLAVFRWGLLVA